MVLNSQLLGLRSMHEPTKLRTLSNPSPKDWEQKAALWLYEFKPAQHWKQDTSGERLGHHTDWTAGHLKTVWGRTGAESHWDCFQLRLVYGKQSRGPEDPRMWVCILWWQQMELNAAKEQVSLCLPPVFFLFLLLLASSLSSSFSTPRSSSMSQCDFWYCFPWISNSPGF